LIERTHSGISTAINSGMTLLFWDIGTRVRSEILFGERANYGKRIVQLLSRQLVEEFGNSFKEKNLRRMVQFSSQFLDRKIVVTLSRQLAWSHIVVLIPLKDSLKREFYTEMCRVERWSVRTLRKKIDSVLFERTALSRKPELTIAQEIRGLRDENCMTPDLVFQDPYLLNFLGL
jgi:hypothetical protein